MKIEFGNYMIRDWRKDDASFIVKYANNRKISINLRDVFPYPYQISDAEDFLSKVLQQNPKTVFAIATHEEAIGSIGLMLGKDVHRYTAEMGFWLAEPFWNKGIMTDAVNKFTDYAFRQFKLHRVFAEPYTTNPASARVLEKAGFVREGILRSNVFKDGKFLDQFLYAKVMKGDT